MANGLPVVTVNRVGFEPDPSGQTNGIQFWGTSFVAGPQGEILYEASTDEEESIIVCLDLDHSEQVRRWWPFLRDRRIDGYADILSRKKIANFIQPSKNVKPVKIPSRGRGLQEEGCGSGSPF